MDRVIFTAARKDNGKIVEGYYLCLHNQQPSGDDLHIIVDECGEYHPIDSRTLKWDVVYRNECIKSVK